MNDPAPLVCLLCRKLRGRFLSSACRRESGQSGAEEEHGGWLGDRDNFYNLTGANGYSVIWYLMLTRKLLVAVVGDEGPGLRNVQMCVRIYI